jgi:NAD(P)-dependent dehydrogenase (short-subunit alcohol dehydrogenase family)
MPRDAAADALAGKVAVVSGASRGIGRACALALARRGVNVVVAAKSATESATLPGTVHGVARECDAVATHGARAMGCVVNLLDEASILACVARAKARYGRIDVLVNNASALWWQDIEDTPTKKYDLIQGVNARGAFVLTRACLREMRAGGRGGRVISMGPPLPKSYKEYETKTAYYMSKCGMSMVALGAAAEGEKYGVTGNALWPATIVESLASENFELGSRDNWRKADILADCVVELCCDAQTTGQTLIDDEYLQTRGAKFPEDFVKYRCNPDVEPKRLLAPGSESAGWDVRRGDVKKLSKDKARSRL